MKRKALFAAVIAACALTIAGCGNSDNGTATSTSQTAAQTQVSETAAQTQEETAAETEAPVTEAETAVETEAPVTETVAETEAPETEAETAAETEAPETEAETAAETEAPQTETELYEGLIETESETDTEPAITVTENETEPETASVETEADVQQTEAETIAETIAETDTEEEFGADETESEYEIFFDFDETEDDDEIYIDLDETEDYDYYFGDETEDYDYYFDDETEDDDYYYDETEDDYYYDETETEAEVIPRPDFDVSDYLVIDDDEYKNMTVQVSETQQVTDDEIDSQISDDFYYLDDYDDLVIKKTEGVVEDGDIVNIDYVGTKDGEEFDGGSAEDYDLTIGSGTFIDGFEEGLIGKEIGSTVELNLTFPEDYGVDELNGADVVFTVTINYVAEMPELSDELAEKLSDGEYTTAEEYRESVRADLQSEYDDETTNEAYNAIMTKLMELYPIDEYPQANVDYYVDMMISQYLEPYASMYGMELEEFVEAMYDGMTLEELEEEELVPTAEQYVAQEIILGAIAEKEGITMTDEELQETLEEYADSYGVTVDELMEGQDYGAVKVSELDQKVMDWLYSTVTIEEISETEVEDVQYAETEAETETIFD